MKNSLPPAGTYIKFNKKYGIAKKNQMGRVSEDGKSIGIWHLAIPVWMLDVPKESYDIIPDPTPKKQLCLS